MSRINYRNAIILMVLSLIIIPVVSYADGIFDMETDAATIAGAIGMELFITIHMTFFVILPLSVIISPNNSKQVAIGLSLARAVFLLYCDFFVSPGIMMVDFFAVFIGAFIVVPVAAVLERIIRKDYYDLEKEIEKENKQIHAHVSNPINNNPISNSNLNSDKKDDINNYINSFKHDNKPDNSSNDSDDPIKFY